MRWSLPGARPTAQVDTAGVQRLQHPKVLRHLERAVVGQHDPGGADPNGGGVGEDLADHDFGAGAGEVAKVVVFGYPVAGESERLGGLREGDGLSQRVAGCAAAADG